MAPPISPEPLDERRLRAALAGQALGAEIQVHEELASTSDLVRHLGMEGQPHGLIVFAESQTAGRGRRENRWSAEPRQDLLFSILLRPETGMDKYARLATLAALGLARGIEGSTSLRPQIKWPNDLLLGGRKFCGILAEMFTAPSGPFLVLGAGVNVNRSGFPEELRDIATSLRLESGDRPLDRTALAIALIRSLALVLPSWDEGFEGVIAEVKARSHFLGRRTRAQTGAGPIEGVAHDLGRDGGLVLRLDDGTLREITSAEQVRAV